MQRNMECVYMVYRTGSFTKAAEVLFASQSAVSMSVQRVEEELGFRIFDRNSHPLRLTEAGEHYLAHVERTISSEETLLRALAEIAGRGKKQLTVGCIPLHARHLIPKVLSRFRELEPEIRVSVASVFPREMHEKLEKDEIDIALSAMPEKEYKDLRFIPAFRVQYLMAVPENFPVNKRLGDLALSGDEIRRNVHCSPGTARVPLPVFADTPFIAFDRTSDFHDQFQRMFDEAGFKPNVICTASTPAAAYDMAKAGIGASIIGSFSVDEDKALRYYRFRSGQDEQMYYFVLHADKVYNPVLRLFIEAFQNHIT